MDKIHPRVSDKLDPWQQEWHSKWFYFKDEIQPVENKNLEKYMLDTIYDEEFQKNMDVWSNEEYVKFRDEFILRMFNTVYFPPVIDRFAELNVKFSIKS